MSVEFKGMATDTLPVILQKGQGNDHQPIEENLSLQRSDDNKLSDVKALDETKKVQQLSEKDTIENKEQMSLPQLENVAKQLQEFIGTMNRGLEFSVDEDSGRDVIKVIDKKSGELIKQYPSEEVLSLVSKLSEATGTFIDSKI